MPRYGVRLVVARFDGERPIWQARCEWPGCDWRGHEHVVKAGAQEDARSHRIAHRPRTAASPSEPLAATAPLAFTGTEAGGAVIELLITALVTGAFAALLTLAAVIGDERRCDALRQQHPTAAVCGTPTSEETR